MSLKEGGSGRLTIEREGNVMTEAKCYSDGFEDRGKSHEPRNAALEAGKVKKMDSPLESLKGVQS